MNTLFFISILLLSFPAMAQNNAQPYTFEESFSDNRNSWILANEKKFNIEIAHNNLIFKTNSSLRIGSYINFPMPQNVNFGIATNVQFNNGDENSGYGIIWGFKDWDNYEYFIITATGYFKIGYFINGLEGARLNWTKTNSIYSGKSKNILSLGKSNNQYQFYINDQYVANAPYNELLGNYIGLTSQSGKKNISFRSFAVAYTSDSFQSEEQNGDNDHSWKGSGSGILFDKNGFIATNYHVVKNARTVEAIFTKNGKKFTFNTEVIRNDSIHDLSILRIVDNDYKNFIPNNIPYGIDDHTMDLGTKVFALGYPLTLALGEEIKLTDGSISSKTGFQNESLTYQISVPVQPGNSGGPLFDEDGNLIGIVNAYFTGGENISYAIKSSYLTDFLKTFPGEQRIPINNIKEKSRIEKIKILSEFTPMIKVK